MCCNDIIIIIGVCVHVCMCVLQIQAQLGSLLIATQLIDILNVKMHISKNLTDQLTIMLYDHKVTTASQLNDISVQMNHQIINLTYQFNTMLTSVSDEYQHAALVNDQLDQKMINITTTLIKHEDTTASQLTTIFGQLDKRMINMTDQFTTQKAAKNSNDEVIHDIAMVVIGDGRLAGVSVAIQSLFGDDKISCSIRLHFVVDESTHTPLIEWFEQHKRALGLESLSNIYYYRVDQPPLSEVTTVLSSLHTTFATATLLKLIPELLFPHLDYVLVVDSDVLFVRDICMIFKQYQPDFQNLRYKYHQLGKRHISCNVSIPTVLPINMTLLITENISPIFATAPEMGDWYSVRSNWPAWKSSAEDPLPHYHGYNTGVVLWDLVAARLSNWTAAWSDVMIRDYHVRKMSTQLGDQDIFNYMIAIHNDVVLPLPGSWNLQMNAWSGDRAPFLQAENGLVGIVHFNSHTL